MTRDDYQGTRPAGRSRLLLLSGRPVAGDGYQAPPYQGTGPVRLSKVPVGPSGPMVASRTIASVPSCTL